MSELNFTLADPLNFRMSSRPGSGGNPTLEELLEAGRTSVSYIHLDEEESPMKKTILVFGLPGRQASSVCSALVGQSPNAEFLQQITAKIYRGQNLTS